MYQIIDKSGQTFGPAPIETLRQWAIERRLTPEMTVIDQDTGQQGEASAMLLGMAVFLDPLPPDPAPAPAAPHRPPQAVSYAYKGSNEPGQPPMLQTRLVAFFIDFMFGMSLYLTLHLGLWFFLLPRVDLSNASFLSYIDYMIMPIVMLYFLCRDSFFPGQSIGKRIANLKVVTTNGRKWTPGLTLQRNVMAVPILFLSTPGIWYVALPLLILGFLAECFAVMTQGKRFGDGLAFTTVVNAS
jgi:uncharacterized RDD family membrane protein YckC